MRVIEPKQRQLQAQEKRRRFNPARLFVRLVILAVAIILLYGVLAHKSSPTQRQASPANSSTAPAKVKTGKIKQFTGQQFRDLYNNFAYPNTARIDETTPITGNDAADARIRQIAISRGYQLRSAPVTDAFQEVAPGYKLQQRAAQPWQDLKKAAQKDAIQLGLTAAYRSANDQRQIFIQRLEQLGLPVDQIASGAYDAQISEVLRTTAIPGYSRHHTGYTVDISCDNEPRISFEYTSCFGWLSANNYEHAKQAGWIPSYPAGAGDQGPDPESWEYVWVGVDAVTE